MCGRNNMERRCCVEAKSFVFTVVEGASVVRLEERRRNFSGLVLLGPQSVGWLISMMESLLWYPGEKDFVRSFREGSKVLIVRRGGNVAGRFLEVAVYAVGGRRGLSISLKVMRGGAGGKLFLSWVRSVIFSNSRMGLACLVLHLAQRS